jgi:hypothetical protein
MAASRSSSSSSSSRSLCTDQVLRGDALPGAGERARMPQITAMAWHRFTLEERRHEARRRRMLVSELEAQIQLNSALVSSATQAAAGGGGSSDSRSRSQSSSSSGGGASAATTPAPASATATSTGGEPLEGDAGEGRAVEDGEEEEEEEDYGDSVEKDGEGGGVAGGSDDSALLVGVTKYVSSEDYDYAHPLETSMEGYVPIAERGPDGRRLKALGAATEEAAPAASPSSLVVDGDGDDDLLAVLLPCWLLELLLPELLQAVMLFLDGDSVGHCFRTHRALLLRELSSERTRERAAPAAAAAAAAAAGGEVLSGQDLLFRELCLRTYLQQSRHKVCQPERWAAGWRGMYLRRPRVRVNGLYALAAEWMKNVNRFESMDADGIAPGVCT